MPNNEQMDDEQSGQGEDLSQGSESSQQRTNDPLMTKRDQTQDPSVTRQPEQADQSMGDNLSKGMSTADTARATAMEKPELAQNVSSGERTGIPKPVKAAESPWFNSEELDELHSRWTTIQIQFVEDPCSAVEQSETMVAETIERVKQMISDKQQAVSEQWLSHDDITTEELRATLLNYRSLLNSLLKL